MAADLKHPRINIIHIPERLQDALHLSAKYQALGAVVALREVDNDERAGQHVGKLYYFDETTRVREIAASLARSLRNVESVSPCFTEASTKQQAHFSVWLVRNVAALGKGAIAEAVAVKLARKDVVKGFGVAEDITLVECPICTASLQASRLARHLAKVHHGNKQTSTANTESISNSRHTAPNLSPRSRTATPARTMEQPITLISRRGTRTNGRRACDSCHSMESVTWRYAESSRGAVYVCGRCKSGLFNRSFDKKDALNLAYQGGAFEMNRRRH